MGKKYKVELIFNNDIFAEVHVATHYSFYDQVVHLALLYKYGECIDFREIDTPMNKSLSDYFEQSDLNQIWLQVRLKFITRTTKPNFLIMEFDEDLIELMTYKEKGYHFVLKSGDIYAIKNDEMYPMQKKILAKRKSGKPNIKDQIMIILNDIEKQTGCYIQMEEHFRIHSLRRNGSFVEMLGSDYEPIHLLWHNNAILVSEIDRLTHFETIIGNSYIREKSYFDEIAKQAMSYPASGESFYEFNFELIRLYLYIEKKKRIHFDVPRQQIYVYLHKSQKNITLLLRHLVLLDKLDTDTDIITCIYQEFIEMYPSFESHTVFIGN